MIFFFIGLKKKRDRKIRGFIFLSSTVFFIYMLTFLPGSENEDSSNNEDDAKTEKLLEKEEENRQEF